MAEAGFDYIIESGSLANNTTSSESRNCFNFSSTEVKTVNTVIIAGSATAVTLCLTAIAIVIVLKEYHRFVYRLVMYLQAAVLCVSLAFVLDTAPVHYDGSVAAVREGAEGLCAFSAFFSQCALWTEHLIVVWIVIYILLLAFWNYNANKRKHEICSILIAVLFPIAINWIPFVKDMYGLAGLWCWIRLTKEDCHSDYVLGVTLQFALLYGPLVLLVLFTMVSFMVLIVKLCKDTFRHGSIFCQSKSPTHQQALREAVWLLLYPLIYSILWGVMITNRIYYAILVHRGEEPYYALWRLTAAVTPLRILFPPLAFILHPHTLRKIFCNKKRTEQNRDNTQPSETAYHVSHENSFSEEDSLVIRGSQRELFGTSSYQSVLHGLYHNVN